MKDLLDIVYRSQLYKNLKLLKLDEDWVVEVAEENLKILVKDQLTLLDYQIDVLQGNVLDLRLHAAEGNQGVVQLSAVVSHGFRVTQVV